MLQCVAECCSVLQRIAVCRSVSQCVAVCVQCVATCGSVSTNHARHGHTHSRNCPPTNVMSVSIINTTYTTCTHTSAHPLLLDMGTCTHAIAHSLTLCQSLSYTHTHLLKGNSKVSCQIGITVSCFTFVVTVCPSHSTCFVYV